MFGIAAPGILRSSRAVQLLNVTPHNSSHDVIGHRVLGLCHIDGPGISSFNRSLIGGRPRPAWRPFKSNWRASISRRCSVFESGLIPARYVPTSLVPVRPSLDSCNGARVRPPTSSLRRWSCSR
jgi:hypothetical protein